VNSQAPVTMKTVIESSKNPSSLRLLQKSGFSNFF
jgi:hypothetical protein